MTLDDKVQVAVKVGDYTSLGAIVVTFLGHLPEIAAGLAVVWWLVRIYYEIRLGERKLRRK